MTKKNTLKDLIGFPLGCVLLITGVTLILVWWQDLVIIFRGVIGFIIALAGLFILYLAGQKK